MTDHPTIIAVLAVLAAVGVGISVFSMRRRRQCRRLCSLATQAAEQGRMDEALSILVAAEKAWAFNAHDGSRSSLLLDLDDYSRVLEQFARLGADSTEVAPYAPVRQSVTQLRGLLSDRSNFGIDGRMMKREAAVRWAQMSEEFDASRRALQRDIKRMKTNAEPGAAPNGGPATQLGNSEVKEGPPSVS